MQLRYRGDALSFRHESEVKTPPLPAGHLP
jgi:hypothetical protein